MNVSNEITQSVRSNSSEIQNASQALTGESKDLERLSGEVANVIGEVVIGVDAINSFVTRSGEISRKNKEAAESLLFGIEKYA